MLIFPIFRVDLSQLHCFLPPSKNLVKQQQPWTGTNETDLSMQKLVALPATPTCQQKTVFPDSLYSNKHTKQTPPLQIIIIIRQRSIVRHVISLTVYNRIEVDFWGLDSDLLNELQTRILSEGTS